jgi:predicted PurR-regulated permease PerM
MKKIYKITLYTVLLVSIIIILIKSSIIREMLYLIFISFIISYALTPLHNKLIEKGVNKKVSAILLIIFLLLIIVSTFIFIIPSILKESLNAEHTLHEIQNFIDKLYEKIKPLSNNKTMYMVLEKIYEKFDNVMVNIFNNIFDASLNLGGNLLSFAVIPIISYYLLADSENLSNRALVLFPCKGRTIVKRIIADINKILGRYIVGQFMLCFLVGILTFIILISLKVEFPVVLSLINAIFNIIPYFGPLFGALPAIIMALLQSPKTAIYTMIWLYIVQQIEGNLLSPKITGDSVSMHPLLVIILLIIGGKIAGFIGMVLAVPIGVVIKVIYEDINYYLF